MHKFACALALAFSVSAVAADDPRLTVHTLVREDIFAGYLNKDMDRFARGEAKLAELFHSKPDQRAFVYAWQGNAAIYRAVLAYEAGKPVDGDKLYDKAQSLYGEAMKIAPDDSGVWAPVGAANAFFADKLPPAKRKEAWEKAYGFYQKMAAQQMPVVDRLPSHLSGELLAGLVMSAQRTGRTEEYQKSLDRMIALLGDSPYGPLAKMWKERPELAAKTNLMCKNCHEPGRLEARKTALAKQ